MFGGGKTVYAALFHDCVGFEIYGMIPWLMLGEAVFRRVVECVVFAAIEMGEGRYLRSSCWTRKRWAAHCW